MKRLRQVWISTEGFTMLEILVVLAVLSIIIAIVLTSFDAVKAKARYGQVRADMDAIAQAA